MKLLISNILFSDLVFISKHQNHRHKNKNIPVLYWSDTSNPQISEMMKFGEIQHSSLDSLSAALVGSENLSGFTLTRLAKAESVSHLCLSGAQEPESVRGGVRQTVQRMQVDNNDHK